MDACMSMNDECFLFRIGVAGCRSIPVNHGPRTSTSDAVALHASIPAMENDRGCVHFTKSS
jgi:hypothetical protein